MESGQFGYFVLTLFFFSFRMGGALGKAMRDRATDADLEKAFAKYDADGNGYRLCFFFFSFSFFFFLVVIWTRTKCMSSVGT